MHPERQPRASQHAAIPIPLASNLDDLLVSHPSYLKRIQAKAGCHRVFNGWGFGSALLRAANFRF